MGQCCVYVILFFDSWCVICELKANTPRRMNGYEFFIRSISSIDVRFKSIIVYFSCACHRQ
ncbi:unnamed protein product [Musa acuminata subsp. malaccensis]|uniref:(wild Malaysian banana) hypothetical protein n=1 Tax=Musa acuminata subsp. malaccensis TaxID=214687 RepID=A0A804ITI9_MUSAM|nr:unnamed protein product [Musa acuminata subsp. malaccensis]